MGLLDSNEEHCLSPFTVTASHTPESPWEEALIRIVTDSSCDLPDEVIDRHRITVVPLTIRFGDDDLVPCAARSSLASCSGFRPGNRRSGDPGGLTMRRTISTVLTAVALASLVLGFAPTSRAEIRTIDLRFAPTETDLAGARFALPGTYPLVVHRGTRRSLAAGITWALVVHFAWPHHIEEWAAGEQLDDAEEAPR